jgi:hypothetical protein
MVGLGTRSRAIRVSTSDDRVGCSASGRQSLRRTVQEPDFSILAQRALVGKRSRANRRRLSDSDVRWSASDRRWFPARPAQHVQRKRNNGKGRIKSALASARGRNDKRRRRDMQRLATPLSLQRRRRRSASTIGGAARDTIIGRADADRVGARPYRATVAKTRRSRSRASRRSLRQMASDRSNPFSCSPIRQYSRSRPEF